jgi:hypothetical protein
VADLADEPMIAGTPARLVAYGTDDLLVGQVGHLARALISITLRGRNDLHCACEFYTRARRRIGPRRRWNFASPAALSKGRQPHSKATLFGLDPPTGGLPDALHCRHRDTDTHRGRGVPALS